MQDHPLYLTLMHWAGDNGWAVQVGAVIGLTLICHLIARFVLRRLQAHRRASIATWLAAARAPVKLLIWMIGASVVIDIVLMRWHAQHWLADGARQIGVIVVLSWGAMRFVEVVHANLMARGAARGRAMDATTADAVGKLLRACIVIVAVLMIVQTLGVSVSGVLAFGGVGGIVVGFAAKDLLANFLGGLMLYFDRPFAVGDWVHSPDREIEGTVEHIGWRLTRIRTFDQRPVYLPNSLFATIIVVNPSRMTHRQIYETIDIRRDDVDKIAAIVTAVEKMLREHPHIDQQQPVLVSFNRFAHWSLELFIYALTNTTGWGEYHRIKQDVLLQINAIIRAHHAQLALPSQQVQMTDALRIARK